MTFLILDSGTVRKVAKVPARAIVYVGTDHTGKSGKVDGRKYRCTVHTENGGAGDGTFRRNGLRWHATDGGCEVAADALNIPVEQRAAAASRSALSPEEQIAADIAAISESLGF